MENISPLRKKTILFAVLATFVVGISAVALTYVSMKRETDTRSQASSNANLSLYAIPAGPDIGSIPLQKNLQSKSITVTQDGGYYLYIPNSINHLGKDLEFSPDGGNTWHDFVYSQIKPETCGEDGECDIRIIRPKLEPAEYDENGDIFGNATKILIDFSEWPVPPVGNYTSMFKIKGTELITNEITIKVKPVNMQDYFIFPTGKTWVLKGCKSEGAPDYRSCANKADEYSITIKSLGTEVLKGTYNGENIWKQDEVLVDKVSFQTSYSTPTTWMGGNQDFIWYPTHEFNYMNNIESKWATKTEFYYKPPAEPIPVEAFSWKLETPTFIPKDSTTPPYFLTEKQQDLTKVLDTSGFDTVIFPGGKNISDAGVIVGNGSDITGKEDRIYEDTGWRTTYDTVKVDTPAYKGNAVRARYWEFVGDYPENISALNFDEWILAKDIGLVKINHKSIRVNEDGSLSRGVRCNQDADCIDETREMQDPMFSVKLESYK